MQYYQCKCGNLRAWASMSPTRCRSCEECGTTLATHPDLHREPEPHDVEKKFNEDTGEPYFRCKWCHIKLEPVEE